MPGDSFLMRGCSVAICVADLPLCGTSCAFAEAVFYVENQASSVKISILHQLFGWCSSFSVRSYKNNLLLADIALQAAISCIIFYRLPNANSKEWSCLQATDSLLHLMADLSFYKPNKIYPNPIKLKNKKRLMLRALLHTLFDLQGHI